ncbi:MAG: hypothetical protein KDC73_01940 [Ignavibacteriae bacterium]|nr:hypothetical protein [Ignavibacteriota bacterium]MCB9243282.1 hypothetical protein [Ignavibacteriales bacterium]
MILISAHSDTNFKTTKLRIEGDSYVGYLDNFVGVYAAMKAYFSGEIKPEDVWIELTYGEETDFAGAIEVAQDIQKDDLVIVMDVTATPTDKDIVIEKANSPVIREFLGDVLQGFSYDLYEGCPDPISDRDEVEVYKHKSDYCFFLGLPCSGGDYNDVEVKCKVKSVDEAARAIIEITKKYNNFKRLINELP